MDNHQHIEHIVREMRAELHRFGQIRWQRRRAIASPHAEADQREDEDGDAKRLMRHEKRHIFRHDGRIHADTDEQHRKNADGHEPVQGALKNGKTVAGAGHSFPPPAVSRWYGWTCPAKVESIPYEG
jgi:hypothetical protein